MPKNGPKKIAYYFKPPWFPEKCFFLGGPSYNRLFFNETPKNVNAKKNRLVAPPVGALATDFTYRVNSVVKSVYADFTTEFTAIYGLHVFLARGFFYGFHFFISSRRFPVFLFRPAISWFFFGPAGVNSVRAGSEIRSEVRVNTVPRVVKSVVKSA